MKDHEPAGEFDLIDWIRQRERPHPGGWTRLGIGDDCAILGVPSTTDVLVTTDMLMDGRHFRLAEDGPEAVGYKALGVNLSDIAAMAGVPRAALVAVALPRDGAVTIAQGLHAGMRPLAERFGVDLVGGDTNAWDGPLVISITLLGEATARGAVRRSGAMPGDAIFVTGPLGGSLAAGRHLRPEPRIAEALALHQAATIHAMVDISDGLSSDLSHVLDQSGGLGAVLDADAIPIHADAREMSRRDGLPALDHALRDGEDFELCLVVPAAEASRLAAEPPSPASLYRIGEITAGKGLWLRDHDGRLKAIQPGGFDHLRPSTGLTITVASEDDTTRLGQALAEVIEPGVVIGLVGPLGAGKTRLVRAIAEALGVDPTAISSPTFVLIHEYEGRLPVYHFDAYRLKTSQAFEDLGVADYWAGAGVCLVEWADRVRDLLPEDCWTITLEPSGPTSRTVRIELPPSFPNVADRLARRLR